MTTEAYFYILNALISFACAGGGAYLGSYLKKKGENLATHEDIDKLIDQVKATTETTKAIEARISDQSWHWQKSWELRRDTIFEVARKLVASLNALVKLRHPTNGQGAEPQNTLHEGIIAAGHQWNLAAIEFDTMVVIVRIVCGDELFHNVMEFAIVARDNAGLIYSGKTKESDEHYRKVVAKYYAVIAEMKRELLRATSTSQSSESSAIQGPD